MSQARSLDCSIRPCAVNPAALSADGVCPLLEQLAACTEVTATHRLIVEAAQFPEQNPNPVLRITLDGKLLYANPASHHLCASWKCKVGAAVPGFLLQSVEKALGAGDLGEFDLDDFGRVYSVAARLFRNPGYVNLYAHDVTERRRMEQELSSSRVHLERKIQERTLDLQRTADDLHAFVHAVAHDLRSPLRAQYSFALCLQEEEAGNLSQNGKQYLQRLVEAGNRLNALVDDLMGYITVAQDNAQIADVQLEALLRESVDHVRIQNNLAGADVEISCPPGLRVKCHAPNLACALGNLLSNAFKFVRAGVRPEVKVRVETGPSVKIWVEDNGIGLGPDQIKDSFLPFKRFVDRHSFPGTGLGLANVKRAMERMGGRVGVESELGKGSRFWVELPGAAERSW